MSYVDFTGCIISPFGGCFLVPADTEQPWGQNHAHLKYSFNRW